MRTSKRKSTPRKSKTPNAATKKRLARLEAAWRKARKSSPVSITNIEPGIYENMAFDQYIQIEALNASKLKLATLSLAHYHYRPPETEEGIADHLVFGSLVHANHLEPATIPQLYAVLPPFENQVRKPDGSLYDKPKATTAYKTLVDQFRAANPGKTVVSQDWMDRVTGMANSLNSHSLARPLFQDGTPEVTLVWKCQLSATDASRWVLCKGRIDWLCNTAECGGILVDLKTTADISRFHEKWAEYGYHRQAAMYVDGYKALTGLDTDPDYWIVAVEKEPPFSVMAAVVSPIAIEAGRAEYRYLVSRVYEAMQNHRFPGPVSPPSWVLPAWYRPLDFQRFYDPGTWSWAKN